MFNFSIGLVLVTVKLSNYSRTTEQIEFSSKLVLKVSRVQEGVHFTSRKLLCSFRSCLSN